MMRGRRFEVGLLVAALAGAGCGARTELLDGAFAASESGAAGAGGVSGAVNVGASGAGTGAGGASGASAGGAVGVGEACTGAGDSCPNGFACVAGRCAVHCASRLDCRADRFCAGSTCPLRARALAAGSYDTCVVLVDNSLRCWGEGLDGQLGDGMFMTSAAPVSVRGFPRTGVDVVQLSLGVSFACAVLSDGTGVCWGKGDFGQLGQGKLGDSANPVAIVGINPSQDPLLVVSGGSSFACAALQSGEARCWGMGTNGQLGAGPFDSVASPVIVSGLLGVKVERVSAGYMHGCVLTASVTQQVRCWGDNSKGQLGVPMLAQSQTPLAVTGLDSAGPIAELAAGGYHTCARFDDGSLRCWGDNSGFQLGVALPEQSFTPLLAPNLNDGFVVAVSAGQAHTCVLMKDQTVRCWGLGGPIGAAAPSPVPVTVAGLDDDAERPLAIAAGNGHTCALMSDGSARCWGDNDSGQLGSTGVVTTTRAVRVDPW